MAWTVPLSLMACIDADDELLALQRDFGYQVRHLRPDEDEAYSEDPVVATALRSLAWAFVEALTWPDLQRLLRELPPGHPLERAILRSIVRVFPTTETDLTRALEETWPERAQELTMTVAEEWMERGEEKGEKKGRHAEALANLVLVLEKRFGVLSEETQQRLEEKPVADLETLLAEAAVATSLAEVLGDE